MVKSFHSWAWFFDVNVMLGNLSWSLHFPDFLSLADLSGDSIRTSQMMW